jgi:hypothetical protein
MSKDLRSPIAKARDAWLESPEGKRCSEGRAEGQYLENRLVTAFIAGWTAAQLAEREACARIAETVPYTSAAPGKSIARLIRARGGK